MSIQPALASELMQLPALETLEISRLGADNSAMAEISSGISSVKRLLLDDCRVDETSSIALLRRCRDLTVFQAVFDKGAQVDMTPLIASLKCHRLSIKHLSLITHPEVLHTGVVAIETWKQLVALEVLELSDNFLTGGVDWTSTWLSLPDLPPLLGHLNLNTRAVLGDLGHILKKLAPRVHDHTTSAQIIFPCVRDDLMHADYVDIIEEWGQLPPQRIAEQDWDIHVSLDGWDGCSIRIGFFKGAEKSLRQNLEDVAANIENNSFLDFLMDYYADRFRDDNVEEWRWNFHRVYRR